MHDFTPEQLQRWIAWQRVNAVSARRSEQIARVVALVIAAALAVSTVVVWVNR